MKHEAFLNLLEGYFGKYPRPALRDAVARYISDYIEADLDVLMKELLLTYSGQYRHTPDIAVMEKAKAEINSRSSIKRIGLKVDASKLLEDSSHLTSGEIAVELQRVKHDLATLVKNDLAKNAISEGGKG